MNKCIAQTDSQFDRRKSLTLALSEGDPPLNKSFPNLSTTFFKFEDKKELATPRVFEVKDEYIWKNNKQKNSK